MDNKKNIDIQHITPTDIPSHEKIKEILKFFNDRIHLLKKIEKANRLLEKEIEKINSEIKNMLNEFEEKKALIKSQTNNEIKNNILPLIEKIRENKRCTPEEIETLKHEILTVPKNLFVKKTLLGKKLTPAEIKICELVMAGNTEKQIAKRIYLSSSTIHTHKLHIRDKLQIKGKKINLKDYLLALVHK